MRMSGAAGGSHCQPKVKWSCVVLGALSFPSESLGAAFLGRNLETGLLRTSRERAHTGNHVHELELERLVPAGPGAKGRVVIPGRQADAREEAVF